MQYTLRRIPKHLDRALRQRARAQNKSLNEVAVQALMDGCGVQAEPIRRRDLADVAGTWHSDPSTDAALLDQRQVDSDLWK